VFEIYERVGRPELGLQFLTRQQFAGLFEEHGEDLKRTPCEADLVPMLAQLAGAQINVIGAEADLALKWTCTGHSDTGWEAVSVRLAMLKLKQAARREKLSRVVSCARRFTSALPTNEPRCIEANAEKE
jgi:hypothetical protein